MEQNIPVFAKKVWKLVRVIYVMLRKNISKSKLLLDLNKMMHHRKITTNSLHNLMFHHHHHHHDRHRNHTPPPGEYEFSCSNSPSTNNHPFSVFTFHKKHKSNYNNHTDDHDMMAVNAAVLKAVEMIHSEAASPVLPGFGWSPVVRQLRVTDSPFPLSGVDEDRHVDEAANRFISRFYDGLRRENSNVTWSRSSS